MKPLSNQDSFFGNNPLFKDLEQEDLNDIMSITSNKRFGANKCVVKQGDPGNEMYFIKEGSVFIRLCIAENEELAVGELYAGEAFGEIALFDRQPRTASVVTAEPCELLVLSRDVFQQYLLEHPQFSIKLLAAMSRRLRAANDFLRDVMHTNVTSRLAETLLKIARAYGQQSPKGLKIDIAFADRELGEYAGIPADIVTAQLKHWQNEGLIKVKHGCLTLLNPDELLKTV